MAVDVEDYLDSAIVAPGAKVPFLDKVDLNAAAWRRYVSSLCWSSKCHHNERDVEFQ